MSHELRTPLNAIIGFSDLMKNRLFGSARQATEYGDYVVTTIISWSANHLLSLVDDVLDIANYHDTGPLCPPIREMQCE